jgi:hypothetical protein
VRRAVAATRPLARSGLVWLASGLLLSLEHLKELTELAKAAVQAPIIVETVRFPDWQHTDESERTVKQALRRTLLRYRLHRDQELFEKTYGYIKQYH